MERHNVYWRIQRLRRAKERHFACSNGPADSTHPFNNGRGVFHVFLIAFVMGKRARPVDDRQGGADLSGRAAHPQKPHLPPGIFRDRAANSSRAGPRSIFPPAFRKATKKRCSSADISVKRISWPASTFTSRQFPGAAMTKGSFTLFRAISSYQRQDNGKSARVPDTTQNRDSL